MIFLRFLTIAALIACSAAAGASAKRNGKSPEPDEAILAAHAAYRAGDAVKLARASSGLERHVLAPWLEYWRMSLRIEETPDAEILAYLARHEGSYLAARLRADWLKALGRRGDWSAFEREAGPLAQDDLEIRCYGWLARLAREDASAWEEARALWREPRDLPEPCAALAERMLAAGEAGAELAWQRLRLLVERGQIGAARRSLAWLPAAQALDERHFALAAGQPQKLLARPPRDLSRRASREALILAIVRLARSDTKAAAEALAGAPGRGLSEAERGYLWSRVGYEAARRLEPEALAWFRRAGEAELSDEQLAWKARAALRAADWQAVRDAIDPMSADTRRDPAWSYWYGRSLAAQGVFDGARAYFLRIAAQPHFYGLLAAEELGYLPAPPEPFHAPAEAEVAQAEKNPGLARALELYRLGLRTEGTREWMFTVRAMDDAQLLAAAELALRREVFDRAIGTADRTVQRHNYRMRYAAPYREVFGEYARMFELEEAWVLGLVRQESRFVADARSSAGAQGLMQLMPATARWVARRIGLNGFRRERASEVDTNVVLGTRYLKFVLDDLGHPVLALAAYNAGPGRARRWRDAKPLEGAVYAETIPFDETRDYVKKVMANTVYYALVYTGSSVPLKQRLGVVPARSGSERFNEELP
jgi:soluble lytic murein transglycosylase